MVYYLRSSKKEEAVSNETLDSFFRTVYSDMCREYFKTFPDTADSILRADDISDVVCIITQIYSEMIGVMTKEYLDDYFKKHLDQRDAVLGGNNIIDIIKPLVEAMVTLLKSCFLILEKEEGLEVKMKKKSF